MDPQDPQQNIEQPQAEAPMGHPEPKVPDQQADIMQFSDHASFNFPMALGWLVTLFAILATMFMWWMSRDTAVQVAEKQDEKSSIMSQIQSPSNVATEKKANDLLSTVQSLKEAKEAKFPMSQFLISLYTKVTNDAVIKSIAVTADGKLSLAGTTKSYRTIADLSLALKSWDNLTDVDITSASVDKKDNGAMEANFSITATIDKNKVLGKTTTASTSTGTSTGTTSVSPSPEAASTSVTTSGSQ